MHLKKKFSKLKHWVCDKDTLWDTLCDASPIAVELHGVLEKKTHKTSGTFRKKPTKLQGVLEKKNTNLQGILGKKTTKPESKSFFSEKNAR